MDFFLAGTDYKSADIDKREEIYAKRGEIAAYWSGVSFESAALSTCNRFEIYGIAKSDTFFPELESNWYLIKGKTQVFTHALRLASGLESQIKGETQILEQLNSWRRKIPLDIAQLWDMAYFEGLQVRREAGLNRNENNIAAIIFEDMKAILPQKNLKIVITGTGKIAGLLAECRPKKSHLIFAAHKNRARAQDLAEYAQGEAVSLRELPFVLADVDFLVSVTASPHFILKKEEMEKIATGRKRTLYIYDLAIPRDIDPQAGKIEGVALRNLDDLSSLFEERNAKIKEKIALAEYLVKEKVGKYEGNFKDWHSAEQVGLKAS